VRPDYDSEVARFGAALLTPEILYADRQARSYEHDSEQRMRFDAYRELLLDWRYMLVRGANIGLIARCYQCRRWVQPRPGVRVACLCCGAEASYE
jgi:hypothetical protein